MLVIGNKLTLKKYCFKVHSINYTRVRMLVNIFSTASKPTAIIICDKSISFRSLEPHGGRLLYAGVFEGEATLADVFSFVL